MEVTGEGGATGFPEFAPVAIWLDSGLLIFFAISGYVITLSAEGRTAPAGPQSRGRTRGAGITGMFNRSQANQRSASIPLSRQSLADRRMIRNNVSPHQKWLWCWRDRYKTFLQSSTEERIQYGNTENELQQYPAAS
jgi:hypothetical protein